ncbi:MAG: cytochrome c [Candidatus Kentron sp. G]|nr:MAG: cytochrome c [Candidatus Kentron sp. G]VFN03190.1 MAG: cytochrome c [Candidatus Kentron sp. G]VFN03481.1 MAG: cytochrome c [Candidatus Kentron sp. G]VFN05681.1 MAG: cytochrome c [Candidatus Kentron sp. G]
MRKFTMFAACAALAVGISGTAMAEEATAESLYVNKGCGGCHGADAKSPMMPTYPKIAGQNAEYIAAQIKDIKSGARANGQSAMMKGIVADLTDEQIKNISAWLAKQQ